MNDYDICDTYRITKSGGSVEGSQEKYLKDGYWYKRDLNGYEGLAEELVYKVLKCSNVSKYAVYERCTINGQRGCRTKNFLRTEESLVTFQYLYEMHTGGQLSDYILKYSDVCDRVNATIDLMFKYTNLDMTNYVSNTLHLDQLTLNTDRHFNNLAVILSESGFSEAPIFDNGDGLLSSFHKFPAYKDIEELIPKAYANPFSGSYRAQVCCLENHLKINYRELFRLLSDYSDSRALNVLMYQLEQFENMYRDDSIITVFNP